MGCVFGLDGSGVGFRTKIKLFRGDLLVRFFAV